jgi:hypothetical protein
MQINIMIQHAHKLRGSMHINMKINVTIKFGKTEHLARKGRKYNSLDHLARKGRKYNSLEVVTEVEAL